MICDLLHVIHRKRNFNVRFENNLARLAIRDHNLEPCILPTDQEMIPDRNAADARAQNFMLKEEMLLTSCKHPQS